MSGGVAKTSQNQKLYSMDLKGKAKKLLIHEYIHSFSHRGSYFFLLPDFQLPDLI